MINGAAGAGVLAAEEALCLGLSARSSPIPEVRAALPAGADHPAVGAAEAQAAGSAVSAAAAISAAAAQAAIGKRFKIQNSVISNTLILNFES